MHFSSVSLEWMVGRATAILEVRPPDAAWRSRKLRCGPGVEPFHHAEREVRVVEALRAPTGIEAGQDLALTSFDGLSLRLHLDYHVRGLSRSPVVEQYLPAGPLPTDPLAARILFLERRAFVRFDPARDRLTKEIDAHAAVCLGAEEACARRAAILERLAAAAGAQAGRVFGADVAITVGIPGRGRGGEPALAARVEDRLGDRLRELFPEARGLSWHTLGLPAKPSKKLK